MFSLSTRDGVYGMAEAGTHRHMVCAEFTAMKVL
jgi:hypothetical protein